MEVTVYHGTCSEAGDRIRAEGLRRLPEGVGPFVTPREPLARIFACTTTSYRARKLGGSLFGAVVTVAIDHDLLYDPTPDTFGSPAGIKGLVGFCIRRDARPDECEVTMVDILGPRMRAVALDRQRRALIALRRQHDLSRVELGAAAGVAPTTIKRFEEGETTPRRATAIALAGALRAVAESDLLAAAEPHSPFSSCQAVLDGRAA